MTFNKSHGSLVTMRTRTLIFYFLTLLLYVGERRERRSENEMEGEERQRGDDRTGQDRRQWNSL